MAGKLTTSIIRNLSLARSGVYFLEAIPFQLITRAFVHPDMEPPTPEQLSTLWKHISRLHEREGELLASGAYGLRALDFENPLTHMRSYFEVLRDGLKVVWRMRQNNHKDFHKTVKADHLPEYYARNFHFQTDGYFSEASARRYDHQVEILFSGTAGAMRRMILPVLRRCTAGEGRFLEIACGAGSATRAVLETFPQAHVTATDLSQSYLKVAQEALRAYPHVDFMQADGSDLPFKDASFDAVYSVYLLHELPAKVREEVVREAFRVLRPGGFLIFADSLQIDDEPELNWALERFPKVYHEPFYKNYSGDRIEDLLVRATGLEGPAEAEHAFFTKVAWLQKPMS